MEKAKRNIHYSFKVSPDEGCRYPTENEIHRHSEPIHLPPGYDAGMGIC